VTLALGNCEIYVTGNSLNHKHPKILGKVASWSSGIKNRGLPDSFEVHYFNSLEDCVEKLKKENVRFIGTSPHAEKSFYDFEFDGHNDAIVFGTEVGGISKKKQALLDEMVKIPMSNELDFMTLSVVVPIVAYELNRQRS